MNVRINQGATMLVKPQNLKRLPVFPAVRDQVLQLYTPYIAGLERVQMGVRVNFYGMFSNRSAYAPYPQLA